jgi:hypothetical protein
MISKKISIKIAYFFVAFLFIGGIYYFFIKDNSDNEALDPLACTHDDDCTYYSPLNNCYRAEPINKEYKSNVLSIVDSEDALCGKIKTACVNYQCAIKK